MDPRQRDPRQRGGLELGELVRSGEGRLRTGRAGAKK